MTETHVPCLGGHCVGDVLVDGGVRFGLVEGDGKNSTSLYANHDRLLALGHIGFAADEKHLVAIITQAGHRNQVAKETRDPLGIGQFHTG